MKIVPMTLAVILSLAFTLQLSGQNGLPSCLAKKPEPFNNCTAAFLGNKIIVDDYSPRGKCVVEKGMKGKLTVSTINFSFTNAELFKKIGFKVAIKNERTNTLWLYSEETFYEIELEKIMAKCQEGDKIVLITVDNEFSLPHNEIAINWGC